MARHANRQKRKKNRRVKKGRAQAQRRMLVRMGKVDPLKKTMLHSMHHDPALFRVGEITLLTPPGHPDSPYRAD